jgi:hypothetical protein
MDISIMKLNNFSWSLGKFEGNKQHSCFIALLVHFFHVDYLGHMLCAQVNFLHTFWNIGQIVIGLDTLQ